MGRNNRKQNLKGFSLLEIVVTLGVLMTFALIVFPVGINKNQKSKLEIYASQIVTDLNYQQQRSYLKNIPTGVSLGGNTYTLFDGTTLSTATDTDIKKYPNNIQITNISLLNLSDEISFNSASFRPNFYGFFRITDQINYINVYINEEGLIWFE